MTINHINTLLVILMCSSGLIFLTALSILLALKFKKYRSRPYLLASVFYMFQIVGLCFFLITPVLNDDIEASFDVIMRPQTIITVFLTIVFILSYVIEIQQPGKVTFKYLLLAISPFLAVSALLIMSRPSPVHSIGELYGGITRPDIILRLVLIFFFIAYPIIVAFRPYDWSRCMISRKSIMGILTLCCLIPPVFVAGMLCGFFPAIVINYFLAITLDALLAYIELHVRIPLTERQEEESDIKEEAGISIYDDPEIWMNPDMTVMELAMRTGTNRTYLWNRIKELGYQNFTDMINRKRVEYICKELEKGTDKNITNLMFEAGFRSRSTASREFKRIKGCTPSEYQESITH